MKLRLTRPAAQQLDKVLIYIAQHNPSGARKVQDRVQATMQMLVDHPFAGHATARRGIRRMIVTPYPYAITYSLGADEVIILGVRHTARRPSP
ncbi:type II toxin-antitoxin system RelE/ParE family toxin [Methylobacterium organophilum]|uniref:Plasmid stabilization system n=1 Tax=Methylobacterium organophilum TaxID=410 RepID=A0ABQ4T640_METOR|nr:type II toxin-antitoxin system RelE/ParE family toxin [Methylobacterium organophilum]GJE25716.1 hypothetical protein LKMONMHP_0555 [Methylobacterium organophilum]